MQQESTLTPRAEFLRRRDAAAYLSVSERWLSVLQKSRQIPHFKRGKVVSFKLGDLDAYMQRFRVRATWE